MSYAILRIKKIKGFGCVAVTAAEHRRSWPCANADPERKDLNRILAGGPDPTGDLRQYIANSGAKIITQGHRASVVAIEVLLAASPEWFAQASPEAKEKWIANSQAWLVEKFGPDNVISSTLHMDESTPHIQAIVCPLDREPRAKGQAVRLNAAKWVDGKVKLTALQDSYADAVSGLGLTRGIRGSKATHQSLSAYYGQLAQSLEEAKGKTLKAPVVPEPPMMMTSRARGEYKESIQAQVNHVVKQANQHLADAAEVVAAAALKTAAAEERARAMERTAAAAVIETAAIRDIPLEDVALALGLEATPQKGKGMYGPVAITGQKWFDHKAGVGGGGAIDFVMHHRESSFQDAKAWLRDRFGADKAAAATMVKHMETVKLEVAEAQREPFARPTPEPDQVQAVRKWLYSKGLDPAVFDKAIQHGDIYAARVGPHVNAVFSRQDGARSAEVVGMGQDRFKGLSARSEPSQAPVFMLSVGDPNARKIVLCESAVKALAYAQLFPKEHAAIVSTAGARPRLPWLKQMEAKGYKFVCAFDNDEAGDKAYRELRRQVVDIERVKPEKVKDWDDLLPKPQPGPSKEREGETLEQQNERWRKEREAQRLLDEAKARLEERNAPSRGPVPRM